MGNFAALGSEGPLAGPRDEDARRSAPEEERRARENRQTASIFSSQHHHPPVQRGGTLPVLSILESSCVDKPTGVRADYGS